MGCSECQSLKHCSYCECCKSFDFSYQPDTRVDHSTHGRGDDSGPDDSDCPCRDTVNQKVCGDSGCGFCAGANKRLGELLRQAARGEPDERP